MYPAAANLDQAGLATVHGCEGREDGFLGHHGNKPSPRRICCYGGEGEKPMNLLGPSGIYTHEGRRMQSAGVQEPQ